MKATIDLRQKQMASEVYNVKLSSRQTQASAVKQLKRVSHFFNHLVWSNKLR